jgi:hypothetical protein
MRVPRRFAVEIGSEAIHSGAYGMGKSGRENGQYLDSTQNGVSLASNTDNNGALLNCLCSILDLEYPALGREGNGIVIVVVSKHDGSELPE